MREDATREARMQRHIRTAALTAILLVPLVTSAPADWPAPNLAQTATSYTYRGTVRAVNARAGTLELITGVGMSLRLVRMTTAATTRLVATAGAPLPDWSPIGSRSSRWARHDPAVGHGRPPAAGRGLSEAREAGRPPPWALSRRARPVRPREVRV